MMKIGTRTVNVLRWLLLPVALLAADYLAYGVMQVCFPFLEHGLLPPGVDINDLSIMDEERIFGPYGGGLFACFAAFGAYLLAPRWKLIVVTVIALLLAPFYLGVASFTLGVVVGAAAGLGLALIVERAPSRS